MKRTARLIATGVIGGGTVVSPPAAPTALTATPASTTQINLAWTDNATNETAYKVYRSTDGVTYAQVGTDLAADANSYNDTTPNDGVTYYYKVAAVNAGGETLSDAATTNTLYLSLSAWWKLDESSNGSTPTQRNDSHGTNHLTDNNTVASGTGKISNGADIEANNTEFLSVDDTAPLSAANASFTVAGWVKLETAGAANVSLASKGANGDQEWWLLHLGSSRRITFVLYNNGAEAGNLQLGATSLGEPSTGQWYYIVAWYDKVANTTNIQVNNGTVDSADATGKTVKDSAGPFKIGGYWGSIYGDGVFDEFAFWKRVLTADERTILYNNGSGVTYPFP